MLALYLKKSLVYTYPAMSRTYTSFTTKLAADQLKGQVDE